LKGVREITLRNEEGRARMVNVKMQVEKVDGFSGHSSRQQLLNYIRRIHPKPRNIILVHGEEEAVRSLGAGSCEDNARQHIRPLQLGDNSAGKPVRYVN
jgi:predicted metal-dependent RNase